MLKMFYPHEYVESVFAIDYKKLYEKGYRAVIFDIDNTLVPHGGDSTPEVDGLFLQIHSLGLKTLLLSNNSEERILRFLKNIDSMYVHEADKPKKQGYFKAIEMLSVKAEEAVVVGDQVFTDILGANKCKLAGILVDYIRKPTETKIGIKRNLEKIVLKFYKKSKFQHRIGDIKKQETL